MNSHGEDSALLQALDPAIRAREEALMAAVEDGKIPVDRIRLYRADWERRPEATAKLVASLAAGLRPSDDSDPDLTPEEAERIAEEQMDPWLKP